MKPNKTFTRFFAQKNQKQLSYIMNNKKNELQKIKKKQVCKEKKSFDE